MKAIVAILVVLPLAGCASLAGLTPEQWAECKRLDAWSADRAAVAPSENADVPDIPRTPTPKEALSWWESPPWASSLYKPTSIAAGDWQAASSDAKRLALCRGRPACALGRPRGAGHTS